MKNVVVYFRSSIPMQLLLSDSESKELYDTWTLKKFGNDFHPIGGDTIDNGVFAVNLSDIVGIVCVPLKQEQINVLNPPSVMGQQKPVQQFGSNISGSAVSGGISMFLPPNIKQEFRP